MLKKMADKANKGIVVNSEGEFLGYHEGVHAYTIGQRRGIEVANGPWFVLEINAEENKIVIGREAELARSSFKIEEVNLLQEDLPEVVSIKIRAQHKFVKAKISIIDAEDKNTDYIIEAENAKNQKTAASDVLSSKSGAIETFEPVSAVSPGQICAFYDGDKLLGGGTIAG